MAASAEHLIGAEAGHAAAVERADLEKAGTAGDLVARDRDGVAQRAGPGGFGGTEDGHAGATEKRCEVHRSAIVAKDKAGVGDPVGEIEGGSFAGEVLKIGTIGLADSAAGFHIARSAHEDRLERMFLHEVTDHGGKGGWVPSLGRAVGRTGKDGEVGLGGSLRRSGQRGWRIRQLLSPLGQTQIFEKPEILVSHVDKAEGGGATRAVFGKKGVAEIPFKSGPVGYREDFQSNAQGIRECDGRSHPAFFQFASQGHRPAGNREILQIRKQDGSEGSKGGGAGDDQRRSTIQPRPVKADSGERED